MRTKIFLFGILGLFLLGCSNNNPLINKVDPFIGTGGHGHTYPGATTPFGMVQLSPDTRIDDWDGCSGYHYSDSQILGFSHTHLSGTGVGDYGDIRLMPTVGDLKLRPGTKENTEEGYISKFSHDNEKAAPAFYQVLLDDYQIDVQLTATRRAGFHQYTFPKSESSHVILDLKEAVRTEKIHELIINIEDNHTISGLRRSASWANDQYCYFVIEFDKDFKDFGIQLEGEINKGLKKAQGKDIQAWFDFDTEDGEIILAKVALSAVSVEGAKKNLAAEIPHWDFNKTLKESQKEWEKELARIEVKGEEKDETIFYTALYHALIAPNTWSDVDGQYRGHDLKVHTADHTVYTVFSLWDTFRGEHPLLTLLHPERVNDMIKSMLLMYEADGLLPVWELAACETNCMIGYHAVPVIYDAYAKGIGDFDANQALDAMIKGARENIFGLDSYQEYGYIKADEEGESVSKTLEYAYDDWCIAMMAKDLGRNDIYEEFIVRAQYYKNLYDASTGFMRAKINGQWQKPFSPTEVNFHFTEANSWQYSMFVPQDVNGLIALHGGEKNFSKKLDELFETEMKLSGRHQSDITGLIGQYAHGNEPSHHMAYLYNFVGEPWKAQKVLSQIMNELYHDQPDGLSGNEDCGQMSAWYVLSSMGFYPVTPGSNDYIIGTPIFESVKLRLDNGTMFEIKAENYGKQNIYVQSTNMNSSPLLRSYITHEEIASGGILNFNMGAAANETYGQDESSRPQMEITDLLICPPPTIISETQTFKDDLKIEMVNPVTDAKTYYTIDGSEPTAQSKLYTKPLLINRSTSFKIKSIHPKWGESASIESKFYKIDASKSLELTYAYSPLYAAGGDLALIDNIRGNHNFKTGTWQGFYNTPVEAIVTFAKKKRLSELTMTFIQDQGSWIFLPKKVSFYISNDKENWKLVGSLDNDIDMKKSPITHDFRVKMKSKRVKYVKIVAENAGPCPAWHLGAGGDTWMFADEIVLK
ncbi:GH92 family glycosyl hydrolase [Lentimicrobium sp. S6]|uniref:GH92 family glycosyl hydrolase n=1 Tax=Lentimicrobium sp. S6 TaxID=2735872 RepID=UPI001553BC7C|nr:GH92 family glycosyl hydrolase [Lentimicrobium sp. S6]NPD45482.1 glycoside hydrolase family 92 protein [Lentimicrobium sp. S6]